MKKYREILVCVIGTTPQIITETLYALATKKEPVFIDEIYVLTTLPGKQKIEETLIKEKILEQLIKDYNLPPLTINDSHIIVFKEQKGNALNDILTLEDNEIVGDTITSFIRKLCKDSNSRLHCSLAGGRKTMSFYLGSALQLFGRPWDKLYHVLVSPEFENNPQFFYKPPRNKVIETMMPDGSVKRLETKDANIYLAELPFIRLRDKIHTESKNFRELIKKGQKLIDNKMMPLPLRVKLKERTVYIGDLPVLMPPIHLAIYTFFLRRKKSCKRKICKPKCDRCFLSIKKDIQLDSNIIKEIAKDYAVMYPSRVDEFIHRYKKGFSQEAIRSYIAKINNTIKKQIKDDARSFYYIINTVKLYGSSRYGIFLDKNSIKIET